MVNGAVDGQEGARVEVAGKVLVRVSLDMLHISGEQAGTSGGGAGRL